MQPVLGTGKDLHMLWPQTGFFVQFPKHGPLRVFTPLNASLRKLPRLFAHALTPEDLVAAIHQDNAYIGAVAELI